MYCHCYKCGWAQDDFWDKDYNPIRWLLQYEDRIFSSKSLKENSEIRQNLAPMFITYKEFIAKSCEEAAKKIREQIFITPADAIGKVCPKCGGSLEVD